MKPRHAHPPGELTVLWKRELPSFQCSVVTCAGGTHVNLWEPDRTAGPRVVSCLPGDGVLAYP